MVLPSRTRLRTSGNRGAGSSAGITTRWLTPRRLDQLSLSEDSRHSRGGRIRAGRPLMTAATRVLTTVTWGLLAVPVLCCRSGGPSDPTAGDGPHDLEGVGPETQALSSALHSAGADVVLAETIPRSSSPFFAVASVRLSVDGQSAWVWEYASPSLARRDADLVSADGFRIGNSFVDWIGPPHFFHSSRLIVLYIGEDEAMLSLLRSVLGPQFAGQ